MLNPAQHTNPALAKWMKSAPARLEQLRSGSTAWLRTKLGRGPFSDRPASSRPRVLVVDDCPVNLILTTALLSRWGIEPLLAADGAEAVALACSHELDLVLMDLQMPLLDGWAATAQIRRHEIEHARSRVPVVAYTSSPMGNNPSTWRHAGLDSVLRKPCTAQALESCLAQWCAHDLRQLAA